MGRIPPKPEVTPLDSTPSIQISHAELADLVAVLCPDHGIDLAGVVALPCPLPLAERFGDWLREGRHGGLTYMQRDPAARLQPLQRNPGAKTLLIFGQGYTRGWPTDDPDPSAGATSEGAIPWVRRVARYARGHDYHRTFLHDIKSVINGLREQLPNLQAHASCDTGPYLEREYSWLAGLGFLGKNSCLIHEKLGSGLFLGVALTNMEVSGLPAPGTAQVAPLYAVLPRRSINPKTAYLSACGSCTKCIEACPTGALGPEGGLDAGACISAWTIEKQGHVPTDQEPEVGGILFGCDICQAVCPWNQKAAKAQLPPVRSSYTALSDHDEITLVELATIDDGEFRRRFRHTPLWRCHPEGMRRNAKRVLTNLEQE